VLRRERPTLTEAGLRDKLVELIGLATVFQRDAVRVETVEVISLINLKLIALSAEPLFLYVPGEPRSSAARAAHG
jgi:hypothetical protein